MAVCCCAQPMPCPVRPCRGPQVCMALVHRTADRGLAMVKFYPVCPAGVRSRLPAIPVACLVCPAPQQSRGVAHLSSCAAWSCRPLACANRWSIRPQVSERHSQRTVTLV